MLNSDQILPIERAWFDDHFYSSNANAVSAGISVRKKNQRSKSAKPSILLMSMLRKVSMVVALAAPILMSASTQSSSFSGSHRGAIASFTQSGSQATTAIVLQDSHESFVRAHKMGLRIDVDPLLARRGPLALMSSNIESRDGTSVASTQQARSGVVDAMQERARRVVTLTNIVGDLGIHPVIAYAGDDDEMVVEAGDQKRSLTFLVQTSHTIALYRNGAADDFSKIESKSFSSSAMKSELKSVVMEFASVAGWLKTA